MVGVNFTKIVLDLLDRAAAMAGNAFNLALIYALIVVYALCYQLQQPIEPFLVEKLAKEAGGDTDVAAA
jgi:hypothetical protein